MNRRLLFAFIALWALAMILVLASMASAQYVIIPTPAPTRVAIPDYCWLCEWQTYLPIVQ